MDHNNQDHLLYDKIRAVDEYINETTEDDEDQYGEIVQALFISYLQLRSEEDPSNLQAMLHQFCKDAISTNYDDEIPF